MIKATEKPATKTATATATAKPKSKLPAMQQHLQQLVVEKETKQQKLRHLASKASRLKKELATTSGPEKLVDLENRNAWQQLDKTQRQIRLKVSQIHLLKMEIAGLKQRKQALENQLFAI